MRRFLPALPAIASTPRRAAISAALIAGIAAGPLAGHQGHSANPTAHPVLAAMTGTASRAPEGAPVVNLKATGSAGATKPGGPAVTGKPAEAAQAAPAPAPSQADLLPQGEPGDQSRIDLVDDQLGNARAIIHASKDLNLPPRAAVIAVATSLQESKLHNLGDLGDLNDHDSLGLFQQRPSSGWGTPEQITNPDYATKSFLRGLVQVNGWQGMPLTDAAQTVQVSAFGQAYAQWEHQAADIVRDNYNS